MKLSNPLSRRVDDTPADPTVVPLFGADPAPTMTAGKRTVRGPIIWGCAVIGFGVIGLFAWAGVSSVSGAVVASGQIRAEGNRKTLKSLQGGMIERIYVREGQRVSRGQTLIEFDDTRTQAELDVLQGSYFNLLAERARYQAELSNAAAIAFPPELLAAAGDPAVGSLIRTQQDVFAARRDLLANQAMLLNQQAQQIDTRIGGLQAQLTSVDEQSRLIGDELDGIRELNAKGYAPLNRVRALERTEASLGGNRGAQVAEITRARESIGQARMEMAKLRQERVTEAAERLREVEVRMTDILPRLRAAQDAQAHVKVISPVDGYVLNLTQFTEGGVAGGGEPLLDVVPANAPLLVDAMVRPQDIDHVAAGMPARIRLTAISNRLSPEVQADVISVSADSKTEPRSGATYFEAQLRVRPAELQGLATRGVHLNPGMPAAAYILTGERTVLDYIIGPLRDALRDSFREE